MEGPARASTDVRLGDGVEMSAACACGRIGKAADSSG